MAEYLHPGVYTEEKSSGVKPIERWDYFECLTCGVFVYRDRTRKLRQATWHLSRRYGARRSSDATRPAR